MRQSSCWGAQLSGEFHIIAGAVKPLAWREVKAWDLLLKACATYRCRRQPSRGRKEGVPICSLSLSLQQKERRGSYFRILYCFGVWGAKNLFISGKQAEALVPVEAKHCCVCLIKFKLSLSVFLRRTFCSAPVIQVLIQDYPHRREFWCQTWSCSLFMMVVMSTTVNTLFIFFAVGCACTHGQFVVS